MKNEKIARIIGLASYLPERVLTNADLEKMVETSDEWIVTRTGMKERRIAREDEFTSDMGYMAAKRAMESASVSADQIDLIIVATLTPDYLFPSTAALIQSKLGATKAAAFDMQAACTGFLYALSVAKPMVESGTYKNILVIASEKLSSFVNYEDRNTCVLFGDGASAAVVSDEGDGLAIYNTHLGADGMQSEILMLNAGGSRNPASKETVENGDHYIRMDGRETFKHAVRRMEEAGQKCIDGVNLDKNEIDWLIAHQANERIIDSLAKRFEMPSEKVYKTIHKYGNTSASAVAIALDELLDEKELESGDNILLVAFGSGLTWGASLLRKL